MNQTLPLPAIARLLAASANIDEAKAMAFVKDFFAAITEGLANDEKVTVKNFGTFSRGNMDQAPVVFTPDSEFAARVNSPFEAFAPMELPEGIDISEISESSEPERPAAEANEEDTLVNTEENIGSEPTLDIPKTEEKEEILESVSTSIIEEVTVEDIPYEEEKTSSETEETDEPESKDESENMPEISEEDNPADEIAEEDNKVQEEENKYVEEHDTVEDEQVYILPHRRRSPGSIIVTAFVSLIIGMAIGSVCAYLGHDRIARALHEDTESQTEKTESHSSTTNKTVKPAKSVKTVENTKAEPETSKQATEESSVAESVPKEPVYDTIGPKNFLTTMAGKYYGEKEFWAYIYDANASHLHHPDRIKPGTRILIPDKSTLPLTGDHKADVLAAKRHGMAIYKRFK